MRKKKAVDTVSVDVSFNEVITASEIIDLGEGTEVLASTIVDLVAEKYRAMIQQPIRHRVGRQDAYDIFHLLQQRSDELNAMRDAVLDALRKKAAARNVTVKKESLADAAVRNASQKEYAQLKNEIRGELPEFDRLYTAVREYYEGMGWES